VSTSPSCSPTPRALTPDKRIPAGRAASAGTKVPAGTARALASLSTVFAATRMPKRGRSWAPALGGLAPAGLVRRFADFTWGGELSLPSELGSSASNFQAVGSEAPGRTASAEGGSGNTGELGAAPSKASARPSSSAPVPACRPANSVTSGQSKVLAARAK
jgi:hypothetical protein